MKEPVSIPEKDSLQLMLDIFAQAAKLPVGLYEKQDGEYVGIFSKENPSLYEAYCRYIQKLPNGKEMCEADEKKRACRAKEKGDEGLTLCHAGIYNYTAPIVLDGDVKGVLLYGELRLAEEDKQKESLERHREAVSRLGLNEEQAKKLEMLLAKTKVYSESEFEMLQATLPRVAEWFYQTFDTERKRVQNIEKITHEIQTRIQSILNAENLLLEFDELKKGALKEGIHEIINSAEALATVVNNLGKFQREYRFRKQRIQTLLVESKRIYGAEAKRKGIDVEISLSPVNGDTPRLEISREHLQLALNNLMHNAIKYSFRGREGRERFVRIRGRQEGAFYAIAFENYGIGILDDEIEKRLVFDENYQGRLTHGEYRTGSGKGLFFVQQVIKRHQGTIDVFSKQMSQERFPEGQPHLIRFVVKLPFNQSDTSPRE